MEHVKKFSKIVQKTIGQISENFTTRYRKTNLIDALAFELSYTHVNVSKEIAVSKINYYHKYDTSELITREALTKRSKQLTIDHLTQVYNNINDYCKTLDSYSDKNTYIERLAVDGSFIHLNKTLSKYSYNLGVSKQMTYGSVMGIFKINNRDPITMQLNKTRDERGAVKTFLENTSEFKNALLIFDRGYASRELTKQLHKADIKFLIRLPKTVKIIPNDFASSQTGDFYNEKEQLRILKYTIGNKSYFLETNLFDSKKYTLEILKEYYHERWEIEEYFKYMKNQLKLGDISLRTETDVKKTILSQLIFSKIIYAFQNIFTRDFQKTKSGKYVINKTLLTKGFIDSNFLYDFLYNKNIEKIFDAFQNAYIKITHSQKGKSYEIICKNPNKKWHVKKRKDNQEKKNKNNPKIT